MGMRVFAAVRFVTPLGWKNSAGRRVGSEAQGVEEALAIGQAAMTTVLMPVVHLPQLYVFCCFSFVPQIFNIAPQISNI